MKNEAEKKRSEEEEGQNKITRESCFSVCENELLIILNLYIVNAFIKSHSRKLNSR